ncbi:MAG: ABC transporter ATP-binding protein [Ilumatobacter sp.]|nr:MAG: ABC transporter ATP-binding protein [Ilumatobacter sp.]
MALELKSISVSFGGVMAVSEVSLALEPGRVTGLIGPNGAGKTTLFNVVSGIISPNSGRVILDGHDLTSTPPHRRARRGVARTFQRLELFGSLSVLDNVRVAAEIAGRERPDVVAANLLEQVGITGRADSVAADLSTGSARLVEVARALAIQPKVLLLDEPASGLDEDETLRLGRLLRGLAADGLAVFLVEHDMELVMDVCDVLHVLDLGRLIASGSPDVVRRDPAVVQAYLGVA